MIRTEKGKTEMDGTIPELDADVTCILISIVEAIDNDFPKEFADHIKQILREHVDGVFDGTLVKRAEELGAKMKSEVIDMLLDKLRELQ